MKKLNFKLEDLKLNKLDLVKGCPTDINGNGQEDDDYNNDGVTDQNDQDYYDGYIDGYENGNPYDGSEPGSDAYEAGQVDGERDAWEDNGGITFNGNLPDYVEQGPDINGEDFRAPTDEDGNRRY